MSNDSSFSPVAKTSNYNLLITLIDFSLKYNESWRSRETDKDKNAEHSMMIMKVLVFLWLNRCILEVQGRWGSQCRCAIEIYCLCSRAC